MAISSMQRNRAQSRCELCDVGWKKREDDCAGGHSYKLQSKESCAEQAIENLRSNLYLQAPIFDHNAVTGHHPFSLNTASISRVLSSLPMRSIPKICLSFELS